MKKDLYDIMIESPEDLGITSFAEEDKILLPLLEEINVIADKDIKMFVRAILIKSLSFWNTPSSRIEDAHPPDEYELTGNVIHTQRTTRLAILLGAASELSKEEMDILIAAALIHDVTKALLFSETLADTIHDALHPYTLDRLIHIYQAEDELRATAGTSHTLGLDPERIMLIIRLVHCSHGIWSPIPETIPITLSERLLHFADFIAASLHNVIDGDNVQEWRWIQNP